MTLKTCPAAVPYCLTPLLHFLPNAALAATIIVAVLSLVEPGALRRTSAYSRSDLAAMAATIALTLTPRAFANQAEPARELA